MIVMFLMRKPNDYKLHEVWQHEMSSPPRDGELVVLPNIDGARTVHGPPTYVLEPNSEGVVVHVTLR